MTSTKLMEQLFIHLFLSSLSHKFNNFLYLKFLVVRNGPYMMMHKIISELIVRIHAN